MADERILARIYSGQTVVWETYAYRSDSDLTILQEAKARAKACGKQLPKNVRVVRVTEPFQSQGVRKKGT